MSLCPDEREAVARVATALREAAGHLIGGRDAPLVDALEAALFAAKVLRKTSRSA